MENALLFSEYDGCGCPGEKEQEIDAAGGYGVCAQYTGQPHHQQASAAYSQAGEKPKRRSDEKGDGNTIQDTASLPRG